MTHMEAVAIRKAGIEGWEPYAYEKITEDTILITGGVPRLLKSGPRKGKPTWRDCVPTKVTVTAAEQEAEEARYIEETGNCGKCFGEGKVMKSWHRDTGIEHMPCKHCDGTGKASK